MAQQEMIPAGADAEDTPAVLDADEMENEIARATTFIQTYQRRTVEGIAAIGSKIREMKAITPHGRFTHWIVEELCMTTRTAERMMGVAALVEQNRQYVAFDATILYELSAPSTPEPVRQAVLNRQIAPTVEGVKAARRAAQAWPADAGEWTPADLDADDEDDPNEDERDEDERDEDERDASARRRSYAAVSSAAGAGAGAGDDLWAILPMSVPFALRKPLTVIAIAGGAVLVLLLCWAAYASKRGEGMSPTPEAGTGASAGADASAGVVPGS